MTTLRLALLAAALAAAPAARAVESPKRGSFELGAGSYTPDIDADFSAPGPYEEMFGSGRGWLFRAGVAKALLTGYGSLELGFQSGYFRRTADAFYNSAPVGEPPVWKRSGDVTTLNIIPTTVTLTYRFDWLAEQYPVPLAPYGRVALERYNWWITDSGGDMHEKGATNGWSMTAGLALMLDFFDPGRARELDNELGVNHTYLYFDFTWSSVDDFGSSKSWDLSGQDVMMSGGILCAF